MVCAFWRSDHGRDVPAGACAPGLTPQRHGIAVLQVSAMKDTTECERHAANNNQSLQPHCDFSHSPIEKMSRELHFHLLNIVFCAQRERKKTVYQSPNNDATSRFRLLLLKKKTPIKNVVKRCGQQDENRHKYSKISHYSS
jgi:hypothetical protein